MSKTIEPVVILAELVERLEAEVDKLWTGDQRKAMRYAANIARAQLSRAQSA